MRTRDRQSMMDNIIIPCCPPPSAAPHNTKHSNPIFEVIGMFVVILLAVIVGGFIVWKMTSSDRVCCKDTVYEFDMDYDG